MLVNEMIQNLNQHSPGHGGGPQPSLDQSQFFRLMIAQLRNQDPTKPQDGTQFLGQLAQFGTVNGIQELQTSIERLTASLGSNQTLAAAGMIGRDVWIPGPDAWLDSESGLRGRVELPVDVDDLTVRILDESGAVVREFPMGSRNAGHVDIDWDGLGQDGQVYAPGRYRIEAEATLDGETYQVSTLVAGVIESVALGQFSGETLLNIRGLGPVALRDIREIG